MKAGPQTRLDFDLLDGGPVLDMTLATRRCVVRKCGLLVGRPETNRVAVRVCDR
jgi:hypothetical protein